MWEWREPGFDYKWKKLEILKQGTRNVMKIYLPLVSCRISLGCDVIFVLFVQAK